MMMNCILHPYRATRWAEAGCATATPHFHDALSVQHGSLSPLQLHNGRHATLPPDRVRSLGASSPHQNGVKKTDTTFSFRRLQADAHTGWNHLVRPSCLPRFAEKEATTAPTFSDGYNAAEVAGRRLPIEPMAAAAIDSARAWAIASRALSLALSRRAIAVAEASAPRATV